MDKENNIEISEDEIIDVPSDQIEPEQKEESNEVVSYRNMFPLKEKDRQSLIKPFSIDSFQETIDYAKLGGNLLRKLWIVLLIGIISSLVGYFVLEPALNGKESFTASTNLLYKERKKSVNEGTYSINTIKDMILMDKNCQAAKTMLNTDLTANQIRSMSRVEVNRKSHFLTLHVTADTQDEAIDIANTLAEMSVKNNLSFYKQKAELTLKSLTDKSEITRRNLLAADQNLVNFQKENKIIDIETSKKLLVESISKEEASQLEAEKLLKTSERELSALEEDLKSAPEKVKREVTRQDYLVFEMQAVQRKLIQLIAEYGEKNPKVLKVKEELARLKKQLTIVPRTKKRLFTRQTHKFQNLKPR